MSVTRPKYSLRSFDFLIKTIGFDIDMAEELNSLDKDRECEFHVDPFLVGITNGEYIFGVYNNFRSLTSDNFPRAINLAEKSIFYNLLCNSISTFKDFRNPEWDFSEFDALECWWLYAVCARNQNLPLWTDAQGKPTRKPRLTSLKEDDWDYIFEVIETEFFESVDWLYELNYRDLPEKPAMPSIKEYEDALSWLSMAYSNIWANKSRLLKKRNITVDSEKHPKPRRKHEFFDFMKVIKDSMAYEYEMIRSRVPEDPGTAGDQAEESWAAFLRNWLPSNYPVVTKGRLIDINGSTSPQVDIIVLNPYYPLGLRDTKHYLAAGVIATFECKLTLRKEHLRKFFKNSTLIKRMLRPRTGNPYDELHQLPIYGLLAHSHNWKGMENFKEHIYESIFEVEIAFCQHPREMPDLICIAATGTYVLNKCVCIGPYCDSDGKDLFKDFDKDGGVTTGYTEQTEDFPSPFEPKGEILGMLINRITELMAYEDHNLRLYADYLSQLGFWGGIGKERLWKKTVLSEKVGHALVMKGFEDKPWSKWAQDF